MRSLPREIYDLDFMGTSHGLLEDEASKDSSERAACTPTAERKGPCLPHLFAGGGSFLTCSLMERSNGENPDKFVAAVPKELLLSESGAQESSIQSSVVATDCDGGEAPDPVTPSITSPRYACVVAIASPDFFSSSSGSKFLGFGLKKRGSLGSSRLEDAVEDNVLCQCVAIDFLPTPGNLRRAPIIVKKLNFTATNGFTSQEIYGHESHSGGECVICLERPLAAILLPCRHFCVCRECLEEIDQCPICRAKFSTYVCYQQSEDSNTSASIHLNVLP